MKPTPHRLAFVIENVKLNAISKNGIVPNSTSDKSHVLLVFVRGDDYHVIGLKQFCFAQESNPLAPSDAMTFSTLSFAS